MLQLEFRGSTGVFEHKTIHSIGADLVSQTSLMINPNEIVKLSTGVFIIESKNVPFPVINHLVPFLMIRPRSSLSSKGIIAIEGTIDADYRDEIKVILHNCTSELYYVSRGDRVAQIVAQLGFQVAPVNNTTRSGGFGSTGI